jgi:hypothetical protein
MPGAKDYQLLVEQAENAVGAVRDPELKRIAFQKILESLLLSAEERDPTPIEKQPPLHPKVKAPGAKRKGRAGTALYLSELIDEGFFHKPKTIAQVKAELENRGHHIPLTSLSGPLQKKCQTRLLRRQKVKTTGKKDTFAYSNW